MAKKVQYCVNHSDVVASDICTRCGKPICYNCILEAYGLVFCSMGCVFRHMVKNMGKVFLRIIVTILKSVFWPFSWVRKLNRRGWLELIMGVGLIVCFIFVRPVFRRFLIPWRKLQYKLTDGKDLRRRS